MTIDTIRMLVDVADADTVYRDVYLSRARALLGHELSFEQYRGFRGVQQQIEKNIAASRAACGNGIPSSPAGARTRAASRCEPGRTRVGALAASTSLNRYRASSPRCRDR